MWGRQNKNQNKSTRIFLSLSFTGQNERVHHKKDLFVYFNLFLAPLNELNSSQNLNINWDCGDINNWKLYRRQFHLKLLFYLRSIQMFISCLSPDLHWRHSFMYSRSQANSPSKLKFHLNAKLFSCSCLKDKSCIKMNAWQFDFQTFDERVSSSLCIHFLSTSIWFFSQALPWKQIARNEFFLI